MTTRGTTKSSKCRAGTLMTAFEIYLVVLAEFGGKGER